MSELGQFLRRAREEKDITLEQIQDVTKIRKRYIEAIEQGEYSVLPGQFYARAFIKSYAEAIGLNPEEVLQQYAMELPQANPTPIETLSPRKQREVKHTSPVVSKWISRLVFYSFLVLLLAVIYFSIVKFYPGNQTDRVLDPQKQESTTDSAGKLEDNVKEKENEEGKKEEENSDTPKEEEPEVEEPENTDVSIQRVGTESNTTTYEISTASKLEITLQAPNNRVWFRLTNTKDNSKIDEALLEQGDEKTWDLSEVEGAHFRIGNMRAISILVNGTAIDMADLPQTHNIVIINKAVTTTP